MGKIAFRALVLSVALLAVVSVGAYDSDEEEHLIKVQQVEPTQPVTFLETFGKGWADRWVGTMDRKYAGKAVVQEATGMDDAGLYLPDAAVHYGVSATFEKPIDPSKGVTLQYEMTMEDGLDCGGAYLKFMTADAEFDPLTLHGETPYTVMFGPDKCGLTTNKVHVIFRHKSPLDGQIEEKHLMKAPVFPTDSKVHLYTLVIKPDNTYAVAIDNEVKSEGSLFEDFYPPFNPPKEIDDPEETKPADWVDEKQIADESATKPDDWDEDQPTEVEDPDAEKPEGWLDNEPDSVDDPSAVKPDDWDDEEDGAWEPPKIENPLCDEAPGCGPWIRPNKPNPLYKGKWVRPLIDNPAYKGEWAPRKIANPRFVEDPVPLQHIGHIGAVALEVWTMTAGLIFDNILVTDSESVAETYADQTWQVKHDAQVKVEEDAKPKKKEYAPPFLIPTVKELLLMPQLDDFRESLTPVVEWLELNPIVLYLVLGSIPIMLVCSLLFCCGGKAAEEVAVAADKKTDRVKPDDKPEVATEVARPTPVSPPAAQKAAAPVSPKAAAAKPVTPAAAEEDEDEAPGVRTRQRRRA